MGLLIPQQGIVSKLAASTSIKRGLRITGGRPFVVSVTPECTPLRRTSKRVQGGGPEWTCAKVPTKRVAPTSMVGSLAGVAVALTLTGLAGKMLFGITATQPAVFALPAAVLAVAALAAGWLPTRPRVSRTFRRR